MHRAAFAAAVAGLLAQQFGEHTVQRGALGQAMAVAAVRAGDVIVLPQSLADSDGNRLLANVKVGDARHARAGVELVGRLLKRAYFDHLLIGIEPMFSVQFSLTRIGIVRFTHSFTP